jgi:WD40 repeat protein
MWRVDGTPGPVLQGTDLAPKSATWSPDGTHLACTTENNTVIVWDANLGTTKWVGFLLSHGETATVDADGKFVGGDNEMFDKQYVFIRLLPSGKTVLQSAHEFLSKQSD